MINDDDLSTFIQSHKEAFDEEPPEHLFIHFMPLMNQQSKKRRLKLYAQRSLLAVASAWIVALLLTSFLPNNPQATLPLEMSETYAYYSQSINNGLEQLKTHSSQEEYSKTLSELHAVQQANQAILQTLAYDNQSPLVYKALLSNFQIQKQIITTKKK